MKHPAHYTLMLPQQRGQRKPLGYNRCQRTGFAEIGWGGTSMIFACIGHEPCYIIGSLSKISNIDTVLHFFTQRKMAD
jgi:hypothetical protein